MPVTPAEIQQIATAVRSEIMTEMESKGLIWFPQKLAEKITTDQDLIRRQKAALRKDSLFFDEIAELELWGPIEVNSVRAYAHRYKKRNEVFEVPKGNLKRYKIITAAVIRLRKKRGYHEL